MSRKHMAKQWLWSIGIANKDALFAVLVGPAKRFEAHKSRRFGYAYKIWRFHSNAGRRRQTDKPITCTLPFVHAHGVITA